MDPKENEVEVNEDAALDAELDAALSSIKTGNEPETKVEVKTEEKAEEAKVETTETEVEDTSTPPKEDADNKYEFRVPNKGKFESDESYEKRVELMDLVKKRKLAKTDDLKKELSEKIDTTKSQLKTLNGKDRFINPLNKSEVEPKADIEEDPALKADQERLRELGGVTKDDLQAIVQAERLATEVRNTLDTFIERHDVLKDEDTREIFFDFVDSNYNWQNKSGKELMTVLELARENMFKPSETIEERVLKGASVAEKVNAMQFPGGTVINKAALPPEVKKSIDELVATGMSEEKALELISD